MASRRIFKQDAYREIGFGNRIEGSKRLMKKDGSSNVRRSGGGIYSISRIYHSLITMKWGKFIFLIICAYLSVNLIFASVYYLIDSDHIGGMIYSTGFQKFMEIFFFSAQSLTTVGYGRLNPTGMLDSTIASVESLIGLLSFAIATGLLYGRFSRPVANVVFSHDALIAPYQGATGFMVRLANMNKSELLDLEANMVMSFIDEESKIRRFENLKLELTKVTMLTMSWTLVHPIDEESPVYSWTDEDFKKKHVEVLVFVRGYEETFSQTVSSRTSFTADEIVFGAKFLPIVKPNDDGSVTIELKKINEHIQVPLFEAVTLP